MHTHETYWRADRQASGRYTFSQERVRFGSFVGFEYRRAQLVTRSVGRLVVRSVLGCNIPQLNLTLTISFFSFAEEGESERACDYCDSNHVFSSFTIRFFMYFDRVVSFRMVGFSRYTLIFFLLHSFISRFLFTWRLFFRFLTSIRSKHECVCATLTAMSTLCKCTSLWESVGMTCPTIILIGTDQLLFCRFQPVNTYSKNLISSSSLSRSLELKSFFAFNHNDHSLCRSVSLSFFHTDTIGRSLVLQRLLSLSLSWSCLWKHSISHTIASGFDEVKNEALGRQSEQKEKPA